MSFYEAEFGKLGDVSQQECKPKIQLRSDAGNTHWLSIKPEAVAEILEVLKRHED